MSDLMARICYARDEEFGPVCGREATRRDEDGNTYCALHDYIAAVAGQISFPIDATPFEMARDKERVHELARVLRDELDELIARDESIAEEEAAFKLWRELRRE